MRFSTPELKRHGCGASIQHMSYCSTEVVILAGGASIRMGSPKALLQYDTEETFLDHLLCVYRSAGVERATVVWSESSHRDERVLQAIAHPKVVSLKTRHIFHEDHSADRLASIRFGLRNTYNSSYTFLQDVDRPFVTPSVIRFLLGSIGKNGYDYSAPDVFGHAGHPLMIGPYLVETLIQPDPKSSATTLRDLLRPLRGMLVPVGSMEEAFFLSLNINTPAEYRLYFPIQLQQQLPVQPLAKDGVPLAKQTE